MKSIEELRSALETAERNLYHANLRRQWLENRLLEAPDEQNFDSVMAELTAQETKVKELGRAVMQARSAWAGADRSSAPNTHGV